jgi:hypothetical protein
VQGRLIDMTHQVQTALTLSDVSMINFCRAGLEAMIGDGLDYLFANEEEAQTWCGTTDLEAIIGQLSQQARTLCLTRGAKGSIVFAAGAFFVGGSYGTAIVRCISIGIVRFVSTASAGRGGGFGVDANGIAVPGRTRSEGRASFKTDELAQTAEAQLSSGAARDP